MDVKKVKVFSQTGVLPQYKTREAACCDLEASFGGRLEVGCIAMIPTGLFTEIPVGYKINILPRSGLSKKGITIPNAPGTIDSDYRGEIKVLLINLSEEDFHYQKGDRIAQMEIVPVTQIFWSQVDTQSALSDTERGKGGFGSTNGYSK